MNLTIQLTPEDYIQATRLHMKPRPFLKWIGYFLIVLALLAWVISLWAALTGRDGFGGFIVMTLFLSYFAFMLLYLPARRCRKIFSQQKSMQIPYSVAITNEGILAKSELSEEKLPWNHFSRWKEGKTLFMIYQSDVIFRMFPKRSFASPEEIVEFRQLLEAKLGAARV